MTIFKEGETQKVTTTEYYGFFENPFAHRDEIRYFYPTDSCRRILGESLKYKEKFVRLMVSGEYFSGKTILAEMLKYYLSAQNNVTPVTYIPLHFDSRYLDLLILFKKIGLEWQNDSKQNWAILKEYCIARSAVHHKPVFVILKQTVDKLPSEIEWGMSELINSTYRNRPICHIVWFLPDKFSSENSKLYKSMTDFQNLTPLCYREMVKMINFRCCVAGNDKTLFSKNAFRRIFHLTSGLLEQVTSLCNFSLFQTMKRGRAMCDEDDVDTAWNKWMVNRPKFTDIPYPFSNQSYYF